MRDLHAALLDQKPPSNRLVLYLMFAVVIAAFSWAALTRVDEVTRGNGKVISNSGEQLIQSLEGGILAKLHVQRGDKVEAGQVLLDIDATRAVAAFREGMGKMVALQASAVRLRAEAYDKPLEFPASLLGQPDLIRDETQTYSSRRQALDQSVAELQRSMALADQEVSMSEKLVARGLISDMELLRMKRGVSELRLQIAERQNKFRADANGELMRIESELAQSRENVVAKQDTARRTTITSPVRGVVKDIRINTRGGIIQPGATIMEIVPLDDRLLIETRVRPQDVAFLREGLPATVKITAYDYAIYGGLDGFVEQISPDTLREDSRTAIAANGEETYYRVLVRTREASLKVDGKMLPIIPGMTTTVDIRSGEKSILDYVLKPVFKAREAFGER